MNTLQRIALVVGATVMLSACSKTVQWEEEVPLNTGEVIWVKRSMPWVYKGGMGNPFDMAMRPTGEQTIQFKYGNTDYIFTGRVQIGWLAISPDKEPALIGVPASYGWNYQFESAYYCVVPYYVQFSPDRTGKIWTWPPEIEPWLYRLPANMLMSVPRLDEGPERRYTANDRDQRDQIYRSERTYARAIHPLYDGHGNCPTKQDPGKNQNWSKK